MADLVVDKIAGEIRLNGVTIFKVCEDVQPSLLERFYRIFDSHAVDREIRKA